MRLPVSPNLMPQRVRKRAVKRDNPLSKQVIPNNLLKVISIIDDIMNRYTLRYAAFKDLMHICENYREHGTGVTAHWLLSFSHSRNYEAVNIRLELLKGKGLIYIADRVKFGIRYYYPTDKAIKELSVLCEG